MGEVVITEAGARPVAKRIAKDYVSASGLGMDLMLAIGGGADVVFKHVPDAFRGALDRAVLTGLEKALYAADASRRMTGRCPSLVERCVPGITGALGGLGGLPGAIIEVPVAVAVIFRGVLEAAEEQGFSSAEEETKKEALRVFAMGGPFCEDDGAEMALIVTKASVTGQTLSGLIQKAAPHLASALGPKIMAQSVPVLGAVSGAAINTVFAGYYREMAKVRFSILREARERGVSFGTVAAEVKAEVDALRPAKRHSGLEDA